MQSGVEASPKNRYVWQAWALFEAKDGNKERARQLFQRGQHLNPVDPVIYQSYGLFEYDCGHVAIARALFKRGVAVGPQHQPAWIVRPTSYIHAVWYLIEDCCQILLLYQGLL